MVSLCNNCDIDRLLQALHENYLSIRTRDGNFESVIQKYSIYLRLKNKFYYLL
jgi:hypothetical protein